MRLAALSLTLACLLGVGASARAQTVETVTLSSPQAMDGLFVDAEGNLFGAGGYQSGDIVYLSPEGEVDTIASGLRGPIHLAKDADGNLYCSNFRDGTVSRIAPGGEVETIATGLDGPAGLAMDAAGNLFVGDWGASGSGGTRIHRITPAGEASVFVEGHGIHTPIGLAFDAAGRLYAANAVDGKIHRISPGGEVELLATVPRAPTRFSLGHMVCVRDTLYVAGNFRHVIYAVTLKGEVSILAGGDLEAGDADGPFADARFNIPNGLAAGPDGDVLWVVYGGGGQKQVLRKLTLGSSSDPERPELEHD